MLVHQANPVWVELFSYVNTFYCSNVFAWLMDTWVNTLYKTCSYRAFRSAGLLKPFISGFFPPVHKGKVIYDSRGYYNQTILSLQTWKYGTVSSQLSLTINRNSLKLKKHTDRKPGAMATSFSSTNQITTVKNLEPIETRVIFFKILNNTVIHLAHLLNIRWWIYKLVKSERYLFQS